MAGIGRAFVVGVPRTTFRADLPDLPGTVDDAAAMAALLTRRGFEATNVSVPTGDELRVERIKRSLLRLADDVGPGDLGVFYFSGHGYRSSDGSGDEHDSWDECLVGSAGLIIDDWFRDHFWPATNPLSRWVVCLDSCFSATAGIRWRNPEPLPTDIRDVAAPTSSGEGSRWRLVLSACGDNEEALIKSGAAASGQARSAVTHALVDGLRADPTATYTQLWRFVAARVDEIRRQEDWVGIPTMWYSGADDSLRTSTAFTAGN